jgi:hypothetical protein
LSQDFGYSHVSYLSLVIDRNQLAMSCDVNMDDQEPGTRRSARRRRWEGDAPMRRKSDPWEWEKCGVEVWEPGECPLLTPTNRQDEDHFHPGQPPSPQQQWDDAGPGVYPHWPGVDDSDTSTPRRLNDDHPGVYQMQALTEPEKFNPNITLLSTSLRAICYLLRKTACNTPLCIELFKDPATCNRNKRAMTEIVDTTIRYRSLYQHHYDAAFRIADASKQKFDRYIAMYDYAENLYNLFVGHGSLKTSTMLDILIGVEDRPNYQAVGFEYEFCPYVRFAKYQVETILKQLAETCSEPGIRDLRNK